MKWSLVPRNVATLVDPPRSVRKPVQPLTADQARAFLTATADDRHGPLFHVAVAFGLRRGEVFGLAWEDVDLAVSTLTGRHATRRVGGSRPWSSRKRRRVGAR